MLLRLLFTLLLAVISTETIIAQVLSVPYYNNFDSSTSGNGWSHYSALGSDDWEIGAPEGNTTGNLAHTSPHVWATDLDSSAHGFSTRFLETPYFDLSTSSNPLVFSFWQKRNLNNTAECSVEYSIGANGTWLLLRHPNAESQNWMNQFNWTGNDYNNGFRESSISLGFIQGIDSVRFRFRISTQISITDGWIIDDFSIHPEFYNVFASPGDTIRNVNKNFSHFEISSTFGFHNEFSIPIQLQTNYWHSTDNQLDTLVDTYLGSTTQNHGGTFANWQNTLPLPQGLTGQNHYIFYELDALDSLAEDDETDNVGFAVLKLDSIFQTNYQTNFDTSWNTWNTRFDTTTNVWRKEQIEEWQLDRAHSGSTAWHPVGSGFHDAIVLESPYVDFTTVNNSICFWFDATHLVSDASASWDATLALSNPNLGNSLPIFNTNVAIPLPRKKGWDCFCKSLDSYDSVRTAKFQIIKQGAQSGIILTGIAIDDVYIGEKKGDISLEENKEIRFTSGAIQTDTLHYYLFNSGLKNVGNTSTEFYWSTDSILDPGDVFLGAANEPALTDTSFIESSFTYNKPTTTQGLFYIIYKADAADVENEMREFNNQGYFKLWQNSNAPLPYFNDFESQIDGWRHESTIGPDQWEWGIPTGNIIDTAFSGQKAWGTNLQGSVIPKSRMHLYTPIFDLSQLNQPVLEFDMFNSGNNVTSGINISYSTDGGYSWNVLTETSDSHGRWMKVSGPNLTVDNGGDGTVQTNGRFNFLFGDFYEPQLLMYFFDQSRDYDNTTNYLVDLSFLQSHQQIQFRFNFAKRGVPVEGVVIDNFAIYEGLPDLTIPYTKTLFNNFSDPLLRTNIEVKNTGGLIAPPSDVKFYLSADTTLSITDTFIGGANTQAIRPHFSQPIKVVLATPDNYSDYAYLIWEIDPQNAINENNEANNIGYFDLGLNDLDTFPYFNDFESEQVDGWSWYHNNQGAWKGLRFLHQQMLPSSHFAPHDGEFYMDQNVPFQAFPNIPILMLQSPSFDFSGVTNIKMSFDLKCPGISGGFGQSFEATGGNMEFSVDGGLHWTLLDDQATGAVNWYNEPELTEMAGQAGWAMTNDDWFRPRYNLDFLSGESNVRVRFRHKSDYDAHPGGYGGRGMRVDNFLIEAFSLDLIAENRGLDTIYAQSAQNFFPAEYSISYQGNSPISVSSITDFFWSTDSILDSTDQKIHSFNEAAFQPNSNNVLLRDIYYAQQVQQLKYYLFYTVDADSFTVETNESNNQGMIVVLFDSISNHVPTNIYSHQDLLQIKVGQTKTELQIHYEATSSAKIQLHVYDTNGRIVSEIEEEGITGQNLFTIPLTGLATGLYSLRIHSNEKKFVHNFIHR